jgi:hypothetical protein
MTQNKIKEIIDLLNTLNEYILSLPDDMLLNIDPRDNESLEQGVQFIKEFNENSAEFSHAAARIEQQIKQFFSVNPEDEELEKDSTDNIRDTRIIKDLDKTEPHTLDESFTYKRPYGFVLGKAAYKGLKTWRSLYRQTLTELQSLDPDRFARLPQEEKFVSSRGKPWFTSEEAELRFAVELDSGFYAEANLSANNIRDNIKALLTHFGLDYREMKIYLREDRDAT